MVCGCQYQAAASVNAGRGSGANHIVLNEIGVLISGLDLALISSFRYFSSASAMMAASWLMAPQRQPPP
jgi:hypothetical protein